MSDIRKLLDNIGPGFCLEKWTSAVFHLQRGVTNSCHHCKSHIIPLEEVKKNIHSFHNTEYKKEQRKIMMSGGRPQECNYCWNVEDNNGISDRLIVNEKPRNLQYYDSIINDWEQDTKPISIDVTLNNTCNLSCSYCGPQSSSTWLAEIEEYGPYFNEYNVIPYSLIKTISKNPYIELFYEYFKEVYSGLENLLLNGGEPLMIKETYNILEYILANPNDKLHLNINSNLCVDDRVMEKFINYIKQIKIGYHVASISIYTSNEAHGKQAEYIRHGLNYNNWLNNVKTVLTIDDVKVGFMATYNVLSVYSFDKLSMDIKELFTRYGEHRIIYLPKYLRDPEFLSIRMLPKEHRYRLLNSLQYLKDNFGDGCKTYTRFEQIISYYDGSETLDNTKLKLFIQEYDRRRNLNFSDTFPEIDWLNY